MNMLASRYCSFCLLYLVGFALLLAPTQLVAQSDPTFPLALTPSNLTITLGENGNMNFTGPSGRPIAGRFSTDPSIADLQAGDDDGEVLVIPKQPGRAVITAYTGGESASATLLILPADAPGGAGVRWSVLPTPGYETLEVLQAVPSADSSVNFYSIEWSKVSEAILRAFNENGQQLWATHLNTAASPLTLKHTLPDAGEAFLNGRRISDHTQIILGPKSAFAANNPINATNSGLPVDGKSMLLHAIGGSDGGLVVLERGRFRDSLVALNHADGSELWKYHSGGRLRNSWTVNYQGDIGIVETFYSPASSHLVIINGKTGEPRFQIPVPTSSTTIDGYRCKDPIHNVLKSVWPGLTGSVFTSNDGNMYMQAELHVESQTNETTGDCKPRQYSFENTLSLLRVTPDGETQWKTFQRIHSDGDGVFQAQVRVFPGESIPDGLGGVLAAWTSVDPHHDKDKPLAPLSRLSRISPTEQHDYTLPFGYWTKGIGAYFDAAMVLGEGNFLYATNGAGVVRFDIQAGELKWAKSAPAGSLKLQHSTAGGGLLVASGGRLVYLNPEGNGDNFPWTASVLNPEDIGLMQTDPFNHTPLPTLSLREVQFTWMSGFIAVEDGPPFGKGGLIYFKPK